MLAVVRISVPTRPGMLEKELADGVVSASSRRQVVDHKDASALEKLDGNRPVFGAASMHRERRQ